MEEWWCGEFLNKNTRLDWWYLDDMWVISSRYQPNIIQKSHTYHPGIIHISTTHITQISPTYHTNIIDISPTYHPKVTWSIFFTTPHLMKRQVLTQRWSKKLHFNIRLRLHFSSSRYYPNIIQKSSSKHTEIIQKSPKNHPEIIQISSSWHRFLQPPTCWKVKFKARYGMTIAGENSTSERHKRSFTRF